MRARTLYLVKGCDYHSREAKEIAHYFSFRQPLELISPMADPTDGTSNYVGFRTAIRTRISRFKEVSIDQFLDSVLR